MRSFEEFFWEIAIWAVLCIVSAGVILLWRSHPAIAIIGLSVAALGGGWMGWTFRRITFPESSLIRCSVSALLTAGAVFFGGLLFWSSVCSCV